MAKRVKRANPSGGKAIMDKVKTAGMTSLIVGGVGTVAGIGLGYGQSRIAQLGPTTGRGAYVRAAAVGVTGIALSVLAMIAKAPASVSAGLGIGGVVGAGYLSYGEFIRARAVTVAPGAGVMPAAGLPWGHVPGFQQAQPWRQPVRQQA